MGLFCASIHLLTDDQAGVSDALDGGPGARVLEPNNGWVSVYVDGLVEQEEGPRQLAAALSAQLGTQSISFSVHDSDIARYWLHDCGELVDEYDSWPGYFEGAEPQPVGGKLDELARLCAPGYGMRDLRRVMAADLVFADDLVGQVAEFLGIGADRATGDYRDIAGGGPTQDLAAAVAGAANYPQTKPRTEYDPNSIAMVKAAARGDIAEVERLADLGTSVHLPAPGPIPGGGLAGGGNELQPEMTPLIAAIANSALGTTRTLLELGADPNAVHDQLGTAVQIAASMGNPDLLGIILANGGNPAAIGAHGQTPLEALAAGKQAFAMLDQTRQLMDSLGLDSSLLDEVGSQTPREHHWDRCEELLRSSGADG